MRRVIPLAVLALACGCGGTPTRPPVSASATLSGRLTAEQYHDLVRQDVPYLAGRTDAELDTIGLSACKVLAEENGWLKLVKVVTDAGVPARDAGELGVYVVGRFCPEQYGSLPKV